MNGLAYYQNVLGLKIIWRTETSIALGLSEDVTEFVISTGRKGIEVELKTDDVTKTAEIIKNNGGKIIYGPFDIRIGKCAVVEDPWHNRYTILDSTKGTFITDINGNITGLQK